MTAVPLWLAQLMDLPALPRVRSGARDNPEDRLCVEIRDMLADATLSGRLRAVWTKVPHEVGYNPADARRSQIAYSRQKAMGFIAGSYDFVVTGASGAVWIEVKAPGIGASGRSPAQRAWGDWCERAGVAHYVVNSVAGFEAALQATGMLSSSG